MDLFPGASLEFRVYILLGAIGVMFFAAILALGVGRLIAMRSSSNIGDITGDKKSPFGGFETTESKPVREKSKKEKPVKERKQKIKTTEEIFSEPEEVEYERKVSFFGKKKKEAVEMLAKPSGYTEEYAPTHTRNLESDDLPEFDTVSYEDLGNDNSSFDSETNKQNSWEDDFLADDDKPIFEEPKQRQNKDKNSPFGGNADWDL